MMNTRFEKTHLHWTLLASALASALCVVASVQAGDVLPLAAAASESAVHAGAGVNVEQRVREELRVAMTELIESGAFGNPPPAQIHLDVDSPAQRVSNLGVLIDSSHAHADGVHVLAVTPSGAAERMGLRAGDVLVGVNGSSLADATAATELRQTIDALADGSTLAFEVRRDGATRALSGKLASVYLPAMHLSVGNGAALASASPGATSAGRETALQGCGRISDFDVAPRQDQLHAAKIISIDGVTPGPTGMHAFRVSAGTHSVLVGEQIESRYLSFSDRQRNGGMSSTHYKKLSVDVAPDTTTLIAARLNEDQRNNPQGGAYWDPVAWKQTAESCR